jgi:hypothetical protein
MRRPANKSAAQRAAERQAVQVTQAAGTINAAGTADAAQAGSAQVGDTQPNTAQADKTQADKTRANKAQADKTRANTPQADGAETASPAAFAEAVAGFEAGRDTQHDLRDDFTFEDVPAPKRLAPHAAAVAATAHRDGTEVAWGRLVLLYDPEGQKGWSGTFRLIAYVRADVEPEMAADPLLGEVGWSWLTDALDTHAPGYGTPSGTVTRVVTEGFGAKQDEDPLNGFELRASWSPEDGTDLEANVAAWCDVLAAAAGLPPQPPGTRAFRPGSARRRR